MSVDAPALLSSYLSKARTALSLITDVRHGANVTRSQVWSACEELDGLCASIRAGQVSLSAAVAVKPATPVALTQAQSQESLLDKASTSAMARAGAGWDLLSHDMRQALVSHEVLKLIAEQSEHQGYVEASRLAALTCQKQF